MAMIVAASISNPDTQDMQRLRETLA